MGRQLWDTNNKNYSIRFPYSYLIKCSLKIKKTCYKNSTIYKDNKQIQQKSTIQIKVNAVRYNLK